MYPITPYKISSEFNEKVKYGPHEGLDFNLEGTWGDQDCGTEIKCIYPGEVILSTNASTAYGNMVVVECEGPEGTRWVRYCHLKERRVKSGLVKRGDVIGTMGSTGNSTACHLHMDVFKRRPTNWRNYYKNVLDWYEDPRILMEVDIIDEMPDWMKQLLKTQLGIDPEAKEGEIRGRVGEITDKLRNYDDLKKRIADLEKEFAGASGEAAEYEERLRISEQGRKRVEEEVISIKRELQNREAEITQRDKRIKALEEEVQGLKDALNPEATVIISKEQYERLMKRKVTDRFTDRELLAAWFARKIEQFKKIFRRGGEADGS